MLSYFLQWPQEKVFVLSYVHFFVVLWCFFKFLSLSLSFFLSSQSSSQLATTDSEGEMEVEERGGVVEQTSRMLYPSVFDTYSM